ncbi:3-dehydroquinate synthase, partial [Bacillus cereus]|nr:3-dehydroquinate synthase [Bacillus cereus]
MENKEAMQAVELRVDLGERSYPIWIGSGLLDRLGEASRQAGIPAGSPILVITDEHVGRRYLNRAEQALHAAGYRTASLTVPPGEQSKSLAVFEDCVRAALEAGCDRMSTVVA